MREQEFQQRLRMAITAAKLPVRLWRQPAGRFELAGGKGFIDGAPVGAADLTGLVVPEGWRLEVEVKGPRTRTTPEQIHWREELTACGALALQLRYDGQLLLEENLAAGVEAIRAAIAARREAARG